MNIGGQNVKNECEPVDNFGKIEESVQCVFIRGTCKNHNTKGIKEVTSSKKWMKKKNGFGWVTRKKVTYSCPVGLQLTNSSNQQISRDAGLSSGSKQGGSDTSFNSDRQVDQREFEPD